MSSRPDTIATRKVNREIVVVLGWGRAILLQLAHPLIAAAVHDHSGFRAGVKGYARRAYQTVGAMLDVTFGTPDEAQRIADGINAIHDRVNGHLASPTGRFSGGTPYSARDGRLLLWVHATLVESMVVTYEHLIAPLSDAEKDQYAAEAVWLTGELGAPRDAIPTNYRGIEAFMREERARGEISVGENARQLAAALLAPGIAIAAPVFRVSRLLTIGLLPDDIRQAYGFEWNERRARRFRRAIRLIRGVRHVLPPALREWPAARRRNPSA
jgi:uncharacterized protein (DUF2236 family)